LKLDRTPIDGRPVFISKNEDKTMNISQQSFKYSTNLEKNKLFVSGLPFSTDKAALENLFKNFGKVKEIRIVTYKNGKSKGLAYVDFEDEQSASKALVQTDGMMIGEHQISVSISNPPKRKQPADQSKQETSTMVASTSLGAGSLSSRISSSTSTTKSATTTSSTFLPRSQLMSNRKKTLNI
jgi:RNA recognition motif-containing protein